MFADAFTHLRLLQSWRVLRRRRHNDNRSIAGLRIGIPRMVFYAGVEVNRRTAGSIRFGDATHWGYCTVAAVCVWRADDSDVQRLQPGTRRISPSGGLLFAGNEGQRSVLRPIVRGGRLDRRPAIAEAEARVVRVLAAEFIDADWPPSYEVLVRGIRFEPLDAEDTRKREAVGNCQNLINQTRSRLPTSPSLMGNHYTIRCTQLWILQIRRLLCQNIPIVGP